MVFGLKGKKGEPAQAPPEQMQAMWPAPQYQQQQQQQSRPMTAIEQQRMAYEAVRKQHFLLHWRRIMLTTLLLLALMHDLSCILHLLRGVGASEAYSPPHFSLLPSFPHRCSQAQMQAMMRGGGGPPPQQRPQPQGGSSAGPVGVVSGPGGAPFQVQLPPGLSPQQQQMYLMQVRAPAPPFASLTPIHRHGDIENDLSRDPVLRL